MTTRFPGVRRVLHFAFGRRGLAAEIDEEIAFHLESTIAELEASGMSPDMAREEAERRFGSLPEYRAALTRLGEARRDGEQRREYFDIIRQHLSYTWRSIRRQPGFALTVVLTLALGIGANAVMFGIVDRLMLRAPEHIVAPDRVRRLFVKRSVLGQLVDYPQISHPDVEDFRHARTLADLAEFVDYPMEFGEGTSERRVRGVLASPEFFKLLGTAPVLGRFLLPSDDSASVGNSSAILSYEFWRREFNGDRAVLGRTISVDGHRLTVLGVAPEGFTGAEVTPVDLWLPLGPIANWLSRGRWRTDRGWDLPQLVVRLAPGVSDASAAAELAALQQPAAALKPESDRWQGMVLGSLIAARSPDRSSEVPVAIWLASTALVVLLIACANVATLHLVRAVQRRREIAVRLALGIDRSRLIGHLLAEGVMLALASGGAALLITAWGAQLIRTFLLPEVAWSGSALDVRTVVFTLGASLTAGILAGLAPAWLESRPDLVSSLKAGGAGGGFRRSRVQRLLILVQAALSVALLIGAGLFIRSLVRVRAIDLGLEPDRVLLAWPNFPDGMSRTGKGELVRRGLERVIADQGIESAALSMAVPFRGTFGSQLFLPGGRDTLPIPVSAGPYLNAVTPGYFATMGTPLISGRDFTYLDGATSQRVAIVSSALAQLLWPQRDPIGQCFREARASADGMPCMTVVGVVSDSHWMQVLESQTYTFYVPMSQYPDASALGAVIVIRPRGDPREIIGALKAELQDAITGVRYVEIQSLQDSVDPQLRSWRLGATLFLVFGALALVVAAIGLYSVMACRVEQRRHEMGVRSALGAEWRDLVQLVVGEGVLLVVFGVGLGLIVAIAAAPAIGPLLYQTSPRDPLVMAVVAAVLLLTATLACLVPALRASRVDPIVALRAD